jgi:lysophospholipase L1-like esterase
VSRGAILAGLVALALAGCTLAPGGPPASTGVDDAVRYVALGDSYTIGTSVAEDERWPNLLVARIPVLELVGNPAVNGYTSADLIADELTALERLRPEFVTLQIGVNDVVQGTPEARYAANVAVILDALRAELPADRIVCVATPDYTVTPQGAAYGDPVSQSAGIRGVNRILGDACAERGIRFVEEIFEISRRAGDDRRLVASDGLHPSGVQYRRWIDAIEPVVRELLGH